ncbi:MAG: Rieske (2Fe-2S) protein [Thermodesulfobacteriota bacterium]|nr:Rieske (2Fe-2S) protein [Thermodesulfobacteriota bacterium]
MDQDKQEWIPVGAVDDFPEGEKVERVVNRKRILVLRHKDRWRAFEALCPHMSRSLQRSRVDGNILECIWHNMRFNIDTGAITYASGFIGIPDLKVYEIRVENDTVYVKDEGQQGLIR